MESELKWLNASRNNRYAQLWNEPRNGNGAALFRGQFCQINELQASTVAQVGVIAPVFTNTEHNSRLHNICPTLTFSRLFC